MTEMRRLMLKMDEGRPMLHDAETGALIADQVQVDVSADTGPFVQVMVTLRLPREFADGPEV